VSDLIADAYATLEGWLALGHAVEVGERARFVRAVQQPNVWDANFAARVRGESPAEIDAVLARIERVYAGLDHRQVLWDPATPLPFEARLRLEGFAERETEVVLVLEGALSARGPAVALRPVESEADWQSLEALLRLDHEEEVRKGFHAAWPRSVTAEIAAAKRAKAPAVRYQLARVDGSDCAFFSAWPGENGVGKVEDLFTRAEFRGRGIGTALIAACVDDARSRGAGPVLIGALADDTPMHMYAALGFRPLCVQRWYARSASI
jgi:GNAT superfamily N-acetyltransferase